MNVPVTIARNKLAASIAASIASNKVLDQENLGERIANILTVGNMVPSEMIEQHRRQYPDVKLPSIDEVDEVLAEFLSNMIVVWEDKEGTIVFSLSEPVRVLSLEYRKNMGAKPVVVPVPEKDPSVSSLPFEGTQYSSLIPKQIRELIGSRQAGCLGKNLSWVLGRVGDGTEDNHINKAVRLLEEKPIRIFELTQVGVNGIDAFGTISTLYSGGLVDIDHIDNLGDVYWKMSPVFKEALVEWRRRMEEKNQASTGTKSIEHVDKIMPFGDLVVVRANDDFRSAKTIEGVLVYLLGEVGWDLTRISNELAEFWVIADIHLADVLQRMVDKKVLALSKPTFESEPVWSLSIGFMEAVNERRSGKFTSAALTSVEERGIGIKRDGGLRRGDLGMLSAPTAPNQSRMFRKQLETDAERGIGKRAVNPMSAEVTAQYEEKKQAPLTDTDLGKLDEKISEAVDEEVVQAVDKKPYTVITRDREGVQILDNAYSINHAVLANYLLAAQFDQAQSGRFNFAFAIFYGNTMYHDIISVMTDELKIDYVLDSQTSRRYLNELTENGIIKLADGSEGEEFEFTAVFDAAIQAELKLKQLMSSSRTAETAHHEAYHAIAEDQFGNASTAVVGEVEAAKPEFILEFMGTKQTAAAARETYDDVMAVLSKVEDNSMLVKLFPPGAFDNLKQYVEQFDLLGTQF